MAYEIEDVDAFLLSMVEALPETPRQYDLRCHPNVDLALRQAAIRKDAGEWPPPSAPNNPRYGVAAVTVAPELEPGQWLLYSDGELINDGRLQP